MSFTFHNLLQNPKAYLAAQAEVDQVVGTATIEAHHLRKLKYLQAVLRESLRLNPTVTGLAKGIPKNRQDEYFTICEGKYHLENTDVVRLLMGKAMRDPRYFGDDADEFHPERMHEDNPDFSRHMKAWKPFGNGSRACIGQNFAWQEAVLVLAMVLQNFDMSFVDPGYRLVVKQTLTVKPKDLYVKARLRKGLDPITLNQRLHTGTTQPSTTNAAVTAESNLPSSMNAQPAMQILFGSNAGTCQSLAQRLASSVAVKLGISAAVRDLDSAVDNLPTNQPVVIITSSYEGQPPDNAARFVTWLTSSQPKDLAGVNYTVFGCGHSDWNETFHRIPKLVNSELEKRAATRIAPFGSANAAKGAVLDDFERWQSELLKQLQQYAPNVTSSHVELAEISTDQRASQLSSGLSLSKVKDVKILTAPGEPEKRHMEIELPPDSVYEAGDYLAVLPLNPDELVQRILKHWSLPRDATITFKTSAFGSLPINAPLSVETLLKGFFELSVPLSNGGLQDAKSFTEDADVIAKLEDLTTNAERFEKTITEQHTSLFDLLERYPEIKMPFANFLSNLLPLHVRQYSISSSPIANETTCTITYTVVKHSKDQGVEGALNYAHEGVATTYLATLTSGDTIQVAVKRTATANLPCSFRLPSAAAQATTPLLMLCAGSGLAPFRGFIQQRATMLKQNPSLQLAPAVLFVGCRSSKGDRLYAEELDAWQKLGAVDVRYAFSQEPDHDLAGGSRYIADRMLRDMEDVRRLWKSGAKVYVCGSRKVQEGIGEAVKKIWQEVVKQEQWDDATKSEHEQKLKEGLANRAVSDIFD